LISIEEARNLYPDDDPTHDFDHILRVTRLALRLAEAEGADLEVVRTAALLHDISRPLGVRTKTDHALEAAEAARDLLASKGASPAFRDAVAHAIAAHRFRNTVEPETLEAKVLFDADKLDAIGAIGVARVFAYAGRAGNPLWRPVTDDPDEPHSAHHEYQRKLIKLKDRMTTESGRRIAEDRHAFMIQFFEVLEAEIGF
jgi:uncharacterized protein